MKNLKGPSYLLMIFTFLSCHVEEHEPTPEPGNPLIPPAPPHLSISCPSDAIHIAGWPKIATTDLNLTPLVISNCVGYKLSAFPDSINRGIHRITYVVKDECGLQEECTLNVDYRYDYRYRFIGHYSGIRKKFTYNPYTVAEEMMTQTVTLGNNSNTIKLNYADELIIGLDGRFPYPSWNGYRFSDLKFRNDSVFIYTQTGPIGSLTNTTYRGKKI